MIKTENLTTVVEFGNDEKANISVNAKYRRLILKVLAAEKKIGDKLNPEDSMELPKIEINFQSADSIDVLIKALKLIKRNFNPPPQDQYALAC